MDWISTPEAWIGLLTLTVLEIVLGIDNLVFLSILSGKLPKEQQAKARQVGLGLAVITRILFLLSIGLIMKLEKPFFFVGTHGVSGRDLILLLGGLFLIFKSVHEIHGKLEGEEHTGQARGAMASFTGVIIQILIIDLVFSIDSVITAVGMVKQVEIMIAAVIISVAIMLVFVGRISDFVEKHPSIKILALAFLILIGVNLIAEGMHQHLEKGYTYFAMAFSLVVEGINIRLRTKAKPVELRHNYPD